MEVELNLDEYTPCPVIFMTVTSTKLSMHRDLSRNMMLLHMMSYHQFSVV